MARLPRGYKLVNERKVGNAMVCDVEIAWWRKAELVLRALSKGKWRARVPL